MTCNGPNKPNAGRPFLVAPFHGWTSIVSYFDHDSPDYLKDGQIIVVTGAEAEPDPAHQASDFPAYWNPDFRQFLYYDGHNGYDYNLWYQPVYAAAAGKVIFAAFEYPNMPASGYGKMVMINHGHGYVTLYGHFSRLLVRAGQRVRAGQQIGVSGNTGHSSGPHLHFTVFHNCTPTDPYGWVGSGPDPLKEYQGEISTYLWKKLPLVTNPAPGMPGMEALPAPPVARWLLLQLPSTHSGTAAFTRAMKVEIQRVRKLLRGSDSVTAADPVIGAVKVEGPASPQTLYSVPDVASIASADVLGDAHQDVLAALARASLVDRMRNVALDGRHTWSGHLMQYAGRTVLVGTGLHGKTVILHLDSGGKGGTSHTLRADPRTGAYAVDLGTLTSDERRLIQRQLVGVKRHRAAITPSRSEQQSTPRRVAHAATTAGPLIAGLAATAVVLVALLIVIAFSPPGRRLLSRR